MTYNENSGWHEEMLVKRIQAEMEWADLSVEQLADRAGIDSERLRFELANPAELTPKVVLLCARALGRSLQSFDVPMPDWATGVSISDDPHDPQPFGFTREFPSGLFVTAYSEDDFEPRLYGGAMSYTHDEMTLDEARELARDITTAIALVKGREHVMLRDQVGIRQALRDAVEKRGEDLRWLAEQSGIDRSVLDREVETGAVPVSFLTAAACAEALGVGLLDLVYAPAAVA